VTARSIALFVAAAIAEIGGAHGAKGTFGCGVYGACFDNSGCIARFSLHHVSDGGCAGY
jgi:hypothetical protein